MPSGHFCQNTLDRYIVERMYEVKVVKIKSEVFILEEHLDKITYRDDCILCRRKITSIPLEERGIVEFWDGWFWICPNCKEPMADFDQTQYKPWYRAEEIRYSSRSRKYWLNYLDKEYGIKIAEAIHSQKNV